MPAYDEDGNPLASINENLGPGPIFSGSSIFGFRGKKSSTAPAHRLVEVCFEGAAGADTERALRDTVLRCGQNLGYVKEDSLRYVSEPLAVEHALIADPFSYHRGLPLSELRPIPEFYREGMEGFTSWGWIWLRKRRWLPITTNKWLVCSWVVWTIYRNRAGLPYANFVSFAVLPCWANILLGHLNTIELLDHEDLNGLSAIANKLASAVRDNAALLKKSE